jgi:hypothetical protein
MPAGRRPGARPTSEGWGSVAQRLPAGYLDTGQTVTHTVSCGVASINTGGPWMDVEGFYFFGSLPSDIPRTEWTAYMTLGVGGFHVTLDTLTGVAENTAYHATQPVIKTCGPLRLGVTCEVKPTAGTRNLYYALFGDASTVLTLTVASRVSTGNPYSTPTLIGPGDANLTLSLGFQAFTDARFELTSRYVARVKDFQANGLAVDMTNLRSPLDMTSRNTAEWMLQRVASPFGGFRYGFGPPFNLDYDVAIPYIDGLESSARVELFGAPIFGQNPWIRTVTSPASGRLSLPNTSWDTETGGDGRVLARISTGWASEQNPSPTDLSVICRETKPKEPSKPPASWQPLSLSIASPVPVLLSDLPWTGSGPVEVDGDLFQVTGSGASVSRTLASRWREWNTVGGPRYHADDRYTTTRHDYYQDDNQDVWGWGLYAYLEATFDCPAATTLTLTVTAVAKGNIPYLFDRSYSARFDEGTSTQRFDLLFPDKKEDGPCYFERVDRVKISGFQSGDYTLSEMQLVQDQPAYVALSATGANGGGGVGTRPWPGLQIIQDGAGENLLWGENPFIGISGQLRKDDEDGIFTSDLGTAYPGGCVRMDSTLDALSTELSRMEGVTVTLDTATMTNDLGDLYGNRLGIIGDVAAPVTADCTWLHPTVPHLRATAGTPLLLPASLPADSYQVPPMPEGTFKLHFRKNLGTICEALIQGSDGKRAPAGTRIDLQITGGTPDPVTDPQIASAAADPSGYAFAAVQDGIYQGSSHFTVYFTGE